MLNVVNIICSSEPHSHLARIEFAHHREAEAARVEVLKGGSEVLPARCEERGEKIHDTG